MVSGVRLANMEVSDMLDVIHFLFEEDVRFVSQEQNAFMETFRTNIYRELYKTEYKYSSTRDTNSGLDALDGPIDSVDEPIQEEKLKVFSPREKTAKPYTPPTEVRADDIKPFGSILDAPIG